MWQVGASKRPAISSGHKWETVEAIKDLAETYGITTYELSGMTTKMNLNYPGKVYAQELIEAHSCNFSLHAEFFTGIMCNESKEYERYSMENSLEYAKFFNCPIVVHPGGTLTNSETQLSHAINNLAQAISNVGIDPNLIYIETMGKTDQFGTINHCLTMTKYLGTRICVDWAHIYARYMATYGMFEDYMVTDILELMELMPFANEQYFHISGIEVGKKGEKKHLPFNESSFPYEMVCNLIKQSSLSGRMIVECGYVGNIDYGDKTIFIEDETGEYCGGTYLIRREMQN